MTKEDARTRIEEIQDGSGLARDHFPEGMKGEMAKNLWHDTTFSYGMEYGYLLAMLDVIGEGEPHDE
jgi:hypothetical protein